MNFGSTTDTTPPMIWLSSELAISLIYFVVVVWWQEHQIYTIHYNPCIVLRIVLVEWSVLPWQNYTLFCDLLVVFNHGY